MEVVEGTDSRIDTPRMTSLVIVGGVFSLPTELLPFAEPSVSVRTERRRKQNSAYLGKETKASF